MKMTVLPCGHVPKGVGGHAGIQEGEKGKFLILSIDIIDSCHPCSSG